jgi:flagellar capping protein FliD
VTHKAGVREPSKKYNNRFNIKQAHGFRKFFSTVLTNVRTKDGRPAIDFLHKEKLLGHALTGIHALDTNYNRTSREDQINVLLDSYLLALPELTISDEERMKLEVKKLQTDISDMKTVEFQLATKDKEINEIKKQFNTMQSQMQSLIAALGNADQTTKNVFAKQLFQEGIYKQRPKSDISLE